jgi:hypothetical protein
MSARTNKNLRAFNETIEAYEQRKFRSILSAQDAANDNHGTSNPARPSASDYICDVEATVTAVIRDDNMIRKFVAAFIMGQDTLSKSRKNYYEQRLGLTFIRKGIWPIGAYFDTVRKGHDKAKV